ncbi:hypothetical protein BC826DRAFT_152844 [Russula brevipes]|nr:hypothetical protein BC826DRAFT_152844 [Russula brevipes]
MKTIKKGATGYEDMVKKFKWYMIQDFFYCRELMLYDTERSTQAKDQKTYLELAKKIEKHAGEYGAPSSLKYCTENLGIKEDEVFKTGVADAITNYIKFLQKTAQENNWVAAHVAMIPCVQSYFYIAADIAADRSVDRETVWYTNWVEPNTAYASSVRNQIELFKTNFALWEKNYDNLVKIFNEACGHEMAIWDAASKHT